MSDAPAQMSGPPPLPDSPPPPQPVPARRWRWYVHTVIISVLPLLALLSSHRTGPALTGNTHGMLVVCAFQMLFFGLAFGLAWIFSRATCDDLLLRWRGGFLPVPLGIFYSVALRIAVGIIIVIGYAAIHVLSGGGREAMEKSVLKNRPQVEALVDLTTLNNDPAYFWLSLTLVSFVVAGLREELWRSAFLAGLRVLWPRQFSSRAGQIGAVAMAAIFFGIGHVSMGSLAMVMTALLGFGLGVIMVLHRSIWPAVIAHGMFNALTFVLLPWLSKTLPELQKTLGQ